MAIVVASGAGGVHAQTVSTVDGIVRGPVGAGLDGATVTLVTPTGDTSRVASTMRGGRFLLLGVTAGAYTVHVRAIGFTPVDELVEIAAGQRIRLEYTMVTASPLTPVLVRESRLGSLEVHRRSVSSVISAALAEQLPISRRSPLALPAILPGVRMYAPERGRPLPSAGAAPQLRLVNVYLDGISLKNIISGNVVGIPQTGAPLPQEAVSELRFSMSAYGAEQAHGASWGINAITVQGDDRWRRSIFTQLQPIGVSAKTFLQRDAGVPAPPSRQLVVGGSLRGPLVRQRLHYAGTAEVNRQGDYVDVVPRTPAWEGKRGSFESPSLNVTALQRLTWAVDARRELDLLWSHRTLDSKSGFSGLEAYEAGISQRFNINVAQLRWRRSAERSESEWSAQLVSWLQKESPLVPGPMRTYPGIILGESQWPFDLTEVQARLVHRGSRTLGVRRQHVVRYGAEAGRFLLNEYRPVNADGDMLFPTDTSTLPNAASVGLGLYDPTGRGDARVRYRGGTVGLWVTDEWRPSDRLLVTAGIRYDADFNLLNNAFVSPWANDADLGRAPVLKGFVATGRRRNDMNNLAPRVSLSFDPFNRGRTFLRAGYGLTFDRAFAAAATEEARSALWRTYNFVAPGTADVEELRRRVRQGQGGGMVSPTMVSSTMQAPEARSASIGFGQRLGDAWAFNVDFVHQQMRHLVERRNANSLDSTRKRVLSDRFGDISLISDGRSARYDALLSQLTYERAHAQLQVAYTLGWARSDFAPYNQAFPLGQPYPMEWSTLDERHRLVVSGFARTRWGLTFGTITMFASPRPYTATDGRDLNRNNVIFDDFAFGKRTVRPASVWRNWYRNVDVRAARDVAVGGVKLSVTAEAFNVFNAANINGYGERRYQNSVNNPIATFGRPVSSFAPRQVQFGMRAVF